LELIAVVLTTLKRTFGLLIVFGPAKLMIVSTIMAINALLLLISVAKVSPFLSCIAEIRSVRRVNSWSLARVAVS